MVTDTQPKAQLLAIITELQKDLNQYKTSQKPNQFVLNKRTNLITQLSEIENNLHFIYKYSIIQQLINQMDTFRKVDKDLDGFIVKINFVENPTNFAKTKINYYVK